MINNYKAQRNVRVEALGNVDLGEPVALTTAIDQLKYGPNLLNAGIYKDFDVTGDKGWNAMGDNTLSFTDNSVTVTTDGSGSESGALVYFRSGNNSATDTDLKEGSNYVLYATLKTDSSTAHLELRGGTDNKSSTTGSGRKEIIFHVQNGQAGVQYLRFDQVGNSESVTLENITLHEITDYTYKLQGINDGTPAYALSGESTLGDGNELITNGTFADTSNWTGFGSGGWSVASNEADRASGESSDSAIQSDYAFTSGQKYRYSYDYDGVTGTFNVTAGGQTIASPDAGSGSKNGTFTASGTDGFKIEGVGSAEGQFDNVSVQKVIGFDAYNAPAYKFGIVSSIYDATTGAMKTSAVAGDEMDVTISGECIVRKSSGQTETQDQLITKINSDGSISALAKTDDGALPNQIGVVRESGSQVNHPIILWQGVLFAESFSHKNSQQVYAKCDEAITKFRPVALFLDNNGDLLCRQQDIPAQAPVADTEYTGADPGKWGIAELDGASGDVIPVTVAGKTHFNGAGNYTAGKIILQMTEAGGLSQRSANDDYVPNALGTVMESTTGDVPITIFAGTPIGTINNYKRTIKVTAKASGAVTQYCPVSLFLDENGNYMCISDNIPNEATGSSNYVWCDFRKWGVAQDTVADGQDVEVIVQGRTNVVDSDTSATAFGRITKISSSGVVTTSNSTSRILTALGNVENHTDVPNKGTIVIF